MKKLVGTYNLGFRTVELYLETSHSNGSVGLTGKKGTQIIVGLDGNWPETLSTLLHEAYECVLVDLSTRYKQHPVFSFDASDFIFLMTHNQLSEAHERVSDFLSAALEPFKKEYEKLPRKKK